MNNIERFLADASSADSCELLHSGQPFFQKLEKCIQNAQSTILIHIYSFQDDIIGKSILNELLQAAERGVYVRLLLDAVGSYHYPPQKILELVNKGVVISYFNPIRFWQFKVGRRLHHKIFIFDHQVAMIGGVNIADKYAGSAGTPPWIDFAVMLTGPIVRQAEYHCLRITRDEWKQKAPEPIPGPLPVKLARVDYFNGQRNLYVNVKRAIKSAQSEITIICSYFLPPFRMVYLLRKMARRGVRVRIFLQGQTDAPWIKRAEKYYYPFFIDENISVYEMPKRVLHAKLIIVDDTWMSLGSYNMNHLSNFSSIETNLEILQPIWIKAHKDEIIQTVEAHSTLMNMMNPEYRKRFKRWKYAFAYLVINASMRLLYSLSSKES